MIKNVKRSAYHASILLGSPFTSSYGFRKISQTKLPFNGEKKDLNLMIMPAQSKDFNFYTAEERCKKDYITMACSTCVGKYELKLFATRVQPSHLPIKPTLKIFLLEPDKLNKPNKSEYPHLTLSCRYNIRQESPVSRNGYSEIPKLQKDRSRHKMRSHGWIPEDKARRELIRNRKIPERAIAEKQLQRRRSREDSSSECCGRSWTLVAPQANGRIETALRKHDERADSSRMDAVAEAVGWPRIPTERLFTPFFNAIESPGLPEEFLTWKMMDTLLKPGPRTRTPSRLWLTWQSQNIPLEGMFFDGNI
ncbi:hypothetical protein HUJ04_005255 [Dendroctonus ponderosae]|nr:hypothetical protein HUJ04_005255 [Dendroctonus ponderosae]